MCGIVFNVCLQFGWERFLPCVFVCLYQAAISDYSTTPSRRGFLSPVHMVYYCTEHVRRSAAETTGAWCRLGRCSRLITSQAISLLFQSVPVNKFLNMLHTSRLSGHRAVSAWEFVQVVSRLRLAAIPAPWCNRLSVWPGSGMSWFDPQAALHLNNLKDGTVSLDPC